jgi:putative endonuclease
MWYTYILQSKKNKNLYVGHSSDLKRRFTEHNQKRGGSYSSKNAPFDLIFYEAYVEKEDAVNSELFYKSGYGREVLKGKLKKYFINR